MATVANDLLDQLMQLSRDDKKLVVRRLLDTLLDDQQETWAEAWEKELLRRQASIDRGETKLIPGPEAMARLREKHQ